MWKGPRAQSDRLVEEVGTEWVFMGGEGEKGQNGQKCRGVWAGCPRSRVVREHEGR